MEASCAEAWLSKRAASDDPGEEARSLAAVRKFVASFGDSRFTSISATVEKTADLLDRQIGLAPYRTVN